MQTVDVYGGEKFTFASYFRKRRFYLINKLLENIISEKGYCTILDIGGTELYWRLTKDFLSRHEGRLRINTINIGDPSDLQESNAVFKHEIGNAVDSEVFNKTVDFIHSNSVIEHVGGWDNIKKMADNITATGKPYYVQTPNFWFPVEPHFRAFGFHWLPIATRAELVLKRPRGFRSASTYEQAMEAVSTIHLLTASELKRLFPNADIQRERVGPFTKSLMAIFSG